jgi:DHA1 family tetracycline resistance protein-like MFS transporter
MTTFTQDNAPTSGAFRLMPLLAANLACTMSMMAFSPLIGPIAKVLGLSPWHAGVSVMMAGVIWMLVARAWGRASDLRGRRRILLSGIAGYAISYAALTLMIDVAIQVLPAITISFLGLVLGRGALGLFYAALPAAGIALVADHIPDDKRTKVMASIGAANAIGMVVGPAIAALLAQQSLSLPLYTMTVLPLIAFVVMWKTLPRVEHHNKQASAMLKLTDIRMRRPMAVAFVAMLSVAIAQITVSFFAIERLGLPPVAAARAAGIALAAVGIALIFAQIVVTKLGWTPQRLVYLGGLIAGIGFGSVALATSEQMLWGAYFVAAIGMGWIFPAFSAMAANRVASHEQGAAAGSMGAAQGLGMVVGPLIGTVLFDVHPTAPYLFLGGLLVLLGLWPERKVATA